MASRSSSRKQKHKRKKTRKPHFVPAPPTLRTPNPPSSSLTVTAQAQLAQYSGPIPDAESLARYGQVIPDAPERILRMAEKQADHRQWLEKRVITSDGRRANAGVVCAFIITMTVVLAGAYLVLQGNSIAGTIFTGMALAGLAGTFIYGTQARREERLRRDVQNKALTRR